MRFLWVIALLFVSNSVQAQPIELSGSFSFSQSNYGNNNYQWTRRWGASVGYTIFSLTQIEFSVQDVLYRTKITGTQDTTFHDQIYSVDWVQSFASRKSVFQPYFKVGIGQLNREASGTYDEDVAPMAIYDSITGVLGAGARIYLLDRLALRVEGVTYLSGGMLSRWRENFSIQTGLSIYL